jgi:hypothetical protein
MTFVLFLVFLFLVIGILGFQKKMFCFFPMKISLAFIRGIDRMQYFWGGCIGQCCGHSEELRGNIGFAPEISNMSLYDNFSTPNFVEEADEISILKE